MISDQANHPWSVDFIVDALWPGRRFRTFDVNDDFSSESPRIQIDTRLSSQWVIRALGELVKLRTASQRLRLGNNPEFIFRVTRKNEDASIVTEVLGHLCIQRLPNAGVLGWGIDSLDGARSPTCRVASSIAVRVGVGVALADRETERPNTATGWPWFNAAVIPVAEMDETAIQP